MSITQNLNELKNTLPQNVTLVAVSKTKPNEAIIEAYNAGQRIFGENKVQELSDKYEVLPKDIEWHMIGHLQRNKVKYIAPFVSLIHGVDSLRLLQEINKQGERFNRKISCLLQVFIATEESKFGLNEEEIVELLQSEEFQKLQHIEIRGLMGMATFTDNTTQIEREFSQLKTIYDRTLNQFNHLPQLNFEIVSMGMSNDYNIAIACGSTMVRIGSTIFGNRNY